MGDEVWKEGDARGGNEDGRKEGWEVEVQVQVKMQIEVDVDVKEDLRVKFWENENTGDAGGSALSKGRGEGSCILESCVNAEVEVTVVLGPEAELIVVGPLVSEAAAKLGVGTIVRKEVIGVDADTEICTAEVIIEGAATEGVDVPRSLEMSDGAAEDTVPGLAEGKVGEVMMTRPPAVVLDTAEEGSEAALLPGSKMVVVTK